MPRRPRPARPPSAMRPARRCRWTDDPKHPRRHRRGLQPRQQGQLRQRQARQSHQIPPADRVSSHHRRQDRRHADADLQQPHRPSFDGPKHPRRGAGRHHEDRLSPSPVDVSQCGTECTGLSPVDMRSTPRTQTRGIVHDPSTIRGHDRFRNRIPTRGIEKLGKSTLIAAILGFLPANGGTPTRACLFSLPFFKNFRPILWP